MSPPLVQSGASRSLLATLKSDGLLLLGWLAVMWGLEIADHLPFVDLRGYGIRPRTLSGLRGIVLAPFLHAGFHHLITNTLPFFFLGGMVLLGGRALFWNVSIFVILAGGLGVWLLAPAHTIHIGASGLIFGYLGFLLTRGFVDRSWAWMLTSVVVLMLYGSVLWGVLPSRAGISWQSHLFGFVAGLLAAHLLRTAPPAAA